MGKLNKSAMVTLRGAQMTKHAEVTAAIGTDAYFSDPASPWQRGSNENAHGVLLQHFPKGATSVLLTKPTCARR